jgi:hypothetical protein
MSPLWVRSPGTMIVQNTRLHHTADYPRGLQPQQGHISASTAGLSQAQESRSWSRQGMRALIWRLGE